MTDQAKIWQPILSGKLREEIVAATDVVAEELSNFTTKDHLYRGSLAGGDAGIALFFHYLDQARPDNPYHGAAEMLLERAIDSVAKHNLWFDFFGGITGIAWACQHVLKIPAGDNSLDEADDGLADLLDTETLPHLYELISGLAGYGVYALERWPRGRSKEILERVSKHLLDKAEKTDQGMTWPTPEHLIPNSRENKHTGGDFNCGVSHGMPAVLGILAVCARLDINREPALLAVKDGVRWLLAQQSDAAEESRFPSTVGKTGEFFPSRQAWCYGDLGIAGLLAQVAHLTQDKDLAEQTVAIGLHAASIPEENDGIVDAPLCHGTAGAAHIFNRLYQISGNKDFLETASRWFERLLAMRSPGEGIGGFLSFSEGGYQPAAGFLEGSAGIGLAMLAATSNVEPAWDRILAMSFPE